MYICLCVTLEFDQDIRSTYVIEALQKQEIHSINVEYLVQSIFMYLRKDIQSSQYPCSEHAVDSYDYKACTEPYLRL